MPSHLSRVASGQAEFPEHSHRHSLFWQFLQAAKPGDGELGELLRDLRDRRDMPRHFPHKTALVRYLHLRKFESGLVARNAQHVYNLYNEFYQQAMHPADGSAAGFIRPEQLIKSGVSHRQLAVAILDGLGIFSNAAQNYAEGGKWTDSADGAADAVIALLNSRVKT